MRLFGQLGCRRTQDRAGVAPDSHGADADHLGVARCLHKHRAGWPAGDVGFDLDELARGLNSGLRRSPRSRSERSRTADASIDGSHAAITAALWGVDEAISRAVPLRLVSVIKPTHPSPDDYDRDLAHAERSLRESNQVLAGLQAPRSRGHHIYVGLEIVKVVALLVAGILLLNG